MYDVMKWQISNAEQDVTLYKVNLTDIDIKTKTTRNA